MARPKVDKQKIVDSSGLGSKFCGDPKQAEYIKFSGNMADQLTGVDLQSNQPGSYVAAKDLITSIGIAEGQPDIALNNLFEYPEGTTATPGIVPTPGGNIDVTGEGSTKNFKWQIIIVVVLLALLLLFIKKS